MRAPGPRHTLLTLLLAGLAGVGALLPTTAAARNIALLIGVGDYGSPGPRGNNLEGPPHDVQALRDVLQRRWGFAAADIRTLVDRQATRAGILAELDALMQRSQPGDDVLVYFSGHGTSALDGSYSWPVPHGSGAFIPSGLDTSSPERTRATLLVGRTDTRPRYEALERAQRRLWVVSDSCYAGSQVRSVIGRDELALPARTMPLILVDEDRARRADEDRAKGRPAQTEPYPYRATVYLSASSEGERATDIPRRMLGRLPTVDGQPHGALTDALLRVLEGQIPADFNRDGQLDLTEVHRAVTDFMAGRAYGHSPQRLPGVSEDTLGQASRSVLAARGAALAPPASAGRAADEPLRVWLNPAVAGGAADAVRNVAGVLPATDRAQADMLLQAGPRGRWLVATAGDEAVTDLAEGDTAGLQAQLHQLALAKRLRLLSQQHRRGALAYEITPNLFGGNFREGERLYFSVRPDREAWLVLLNIDAQGRATVLFPFDPRRDLRALPAGQASAIPGSHPAEQIQVEAPLGMDWQLAIAFDQRPAEYERLLNTRGVDPADARLLLLQRMISQASGRFSAAESWLRTSAAR